MASMADFKKLLSGPKGKWILGGAAVVALLAIYMRSKSGSSGSVGLSEYPTYTGGSSSGGGSGSSSSDGVSRSELNSLIGDMQTRSDQQSRDFMTALSNQSSQFAGLYGSLTDKLTASNAAMAGKIDSLNTGLNASKAANQSLYDQLAGRLDSQGQMYGAYISKMDSQMADLQYQTNQKLLAAAGAKSTNGTYAPLIDYTDHTVYNSSNPSSQNAYNSITQPAYGYGGGNYYGGNSAVSQSIAQNEQKLASDAGYKASEVQRAQQVIADRNAAGIETSEQKSYLDKLTQGGGNYNNLSRTEQQQMEQNANRIKSGDTSYITSEIARANQVIKEREKAGLDTSAQYDYLRQLRAG